MLANVLDPDQRWQNQGWSGSKLLDTSNTFAKKIYCIHTALLHTHKMFYLRNKKIDLDLPLGPQV